MFDQRKMRRMMKQAGIKMKEIEAEEVVIKTADEEYVFKNPEVAEISASGQKTFQLSGDYTIRKRKKEFPDKDIEMVMEQTKCTKEKAEAALQKTDGDIAAAILQLTGE